MVFLTRSTEKFLSFPVGPKPVGNFLKQYPVEVWLAELGVAAVSEPKPVAAAGTTVSSTNGPGPDVGGDDAASSNDCVESAEGELRPVSGNTCDLIAVDGMLRDVEEGTLPIIPDNYRVAILGLSTMPRSLAPLRLALDPAVAKHFVRTRTGDSFDARRHLVAWGEILKHHHFHLVQPPMVKPTPHSVAPLLVR